MTILSNFMLLDCTNRNLIKHWTFFHISIGLKSVCGCLFFLILQRQCLQTARHLWWKLCCFHLFTSKLLCLDLIWQPVTDFKLPNWQVQALVSYIRGPFDSHHPHLRCWQEIPYDLSFPLSSNTFGKLKFAFIVLTFIPRIRRFDAQLAKTYSEQYQLYDDRNEQKLHLQVR